MCDGKRPGSLGSTSRTHAGFHPIGPNGTAPVRFTAEAPVTRPLRMATPLPPWLHTGGRISLDRPQPEKVQGTLTGRPCSDLT